MGDFLNELNDVQREAVQEYNGPGLIIAGAGSGKTRVLIYRIAWILKQGIPASSILALTFTNKAASEMKERISILVGTEISKYLWMGTFHSIFARILRVESAHAGYTSNFTIYDTQDSKSVIKAIIKELMLDEQIYKPGEVFGRISSAKNNLISAGAYAANTRITAEDARNRKPAIADIFRIYQSRCRAADAMDFDDLLLNTNILFRDVPEVLKKYQDMFRYILVDEYQDTNYAQYLIVSKLSYKHKNISVVGDDAQSIYSFRGARIENILNFKNDYPGHKTFKLEQNYRSTKNIVNAANSLIARNKGQIPKKVWSAKEAGEKLRVLQCPTDLEEGKVIAGLIADKKMSARCDYADFAVLYRTNAQSRIFEEALRRRGIPYKVYGSLSFYQRKEIKDLLAYFRFTVNNLDQEAFNRIINYPARGIGKTTTDKLTAWSNNHGVSCWEIISNIEKHRAALDINKGTAAKLASFGRLMQGFSLKAPEDDAWSLAIHIATASGILKDLFDPNSTENIAKYENIQELLNAVKEFTRQQEEAGESASLTTFLQTVSLLSDADTEKPDDRDKVTLMTIHSAKGLEFDHIFIGGLEEELFPNKFSAASETELEEERRLFYVAITRAGSTATISHAQSRYRWGVPTMCRPSRFISEIDAQFIEIPEPELHGSELADHSVNVNGPGFSESQNKIYSGKTGNRFHTKQSDKPAETVKPLIQRKRLTRIDQGGGSKNAAVSGYSSEERKPATDNQSALQTGMIVEHERFGRGRITAIEGDSPNTKATVLFTTSGQKHLLLKFAKLKIINP
ncbi:MAG: ATP-dependent helicase [Bacteroidales bacterium]